MKKIILLMLAAGSTLSLAAQSTKNYLDDSQLSRWVVDIDVPLGFSSQGYTSPNSMGNYLNALNANTGNLKFKNGYAYGADGQLGFFFGKKRHFGIGAGVMYMMQQGDAVLDNYHMEFQATDYKGSTYRESVTGSNIKENLSITNINIPIVLKYKNRFSRRWGFAADAGILYNVQMQNAYTTHANFDYEAIYQFGVVGDNPKVPIYDNSPVPSQNDWFITKAEFLKNNPNGNIQDYFNAKSNLGYNVGLNRPAANTKGTVSYPQGNIGLLLRPSFNYFLSDRIALNLGAFYMFQPFTNKTSTAYHLSDVVGSYSSSLNNVSKVNNQMYGINIGAKIFFGGAKREHRSTLASIDPTSPTSCGVADGSIVLTGLSPDRHVTVNYSLNGGQKNEYTSTSTADGKIKITNLSAGEYTDIIATERRESFSGKTVTLVDPAMVPPSDISANPTAPGTCNGFVIFKGMQPGSYATINYNVDGSAHAAFSGVVDADRLLTMTGLCEGKYSGVVATVNKCSANCQDFTLAVPAPVQQVVTITTEDTKTVISNTKTANTKTTYTKTDDDDNTTSTNTYEKVDISTPMLFDVNLYVLHIDAYPVIEEAVRELKRNKGSVLLVQGNADSTGIEAKNIPLSLNRANAVKHELTKRGIKASRITTVGHGSQDPVATNKTYTGKEENRNAVMTITPAKNEKIIGLK